MRAYVDFVREDLHEDLYIEVVKYEDEDTETPYTLHFYTHSINFDVDMSREDIYELIARLEHCLDNG